MIEQDAFKKFKLGETKIGRLGGTVAFFSEYTDSNMSFLYHRHVVSTVAYGGRNRLAFALFNKLNDLFRRINFKNYKNNFKPNINEFLICLYPIRYGCFLSRRQSTTQNGIAFQAYWTKFLFHFVLEYMKQSFSVYNQCIYVIVLFIHTEKNLKYTDFKLNLV